MISIPNFQGDIETNENILKEHSTDASVFEVKPTAIVFPKTVEDIVSVMKFIDGQDELSLSVRAGGTCMSGGSLNTGLILNMTRYMSSIEIRPFDKTANVEMGAMFRDIERKAGQMGLMFAPYTSSKDICGIGGMIGNNASGEKSVRYGATVDNVSELEVVLASGDVITTKPVSIKSIKDGTFVGTEKEKELYVSVLAEHELYATDLRKEIGNVSNIASGYRLERVVNPVKKTINLTPLFIGAQGTLGIVTKAKLKLEKIPSFTRLALIAVDTLGELPFILSTIMKHNPEGVETFDINTFERAKRLLPEETTIIEPYFAKTASLIVLAQFSEITQEDTDTQTQMCIKDLNTHPVRVTYVDDPVLQAAAWKIRRSSYGVMRDFNEGTFNAVPCIEDVIVPVEKFSEFIPQLETILTKYNLFYGYHGHIGDGSLRIIPVIDLGKPEAAETIISLCKDVFALVKSLGGNMSTDHSDGIIRSPFLKEFYGTTYKAFVDLKQLFDPKGILNPKKKTNSSEDDIKKWLKK